MNLQMFPENSSLCFDNRFNGRSQTQAVLSIAHNTIEQSYFLILLKDADIIESSSYSLWLLEYFQCTKTYRRSNI
ncbi:ANL_HP_G0206600.mRNA.1.CDS.1 [Saccharomyces cerevisiae]|nr:ANL_HP_G0206600.mRNA.1.CDS.1 [Saccharomyces cerevisiae]CAI6522287.1 ANL_HP_G0206600.mRNA.1.CDS.1 [Saccharomyces cerevisiae]